MRTIRFLRWGDKEDAVLHCPSVVGGNATTLSRHLNEIGCSSICVAYERHSFGYHADVTLWRQDAGLLRREFIRVISVFRAVLGYQTIHFNFGTTMASPSIPPHKGDLGFFLYLLRRLHSAYSEGLQLIELSLVRMLKRDVFVTFQGDDVRQGDVSRAIFKQSIALHTDSSYYNPLSDLIKRRRARRICSVAKEISYVNPDLAHFLPIRSRFVPYCHTEVIDVQPTPAPKETVGIRFVHAPSHRGSKGTAVVLSVVSQLEQEGRNVRLTLLENVPQSQVWKSLESNDILIDQLYAGWYGGIAVEAFARARPVMAFIRETDLGVVDPQMVAELPVIRTSADTLREDILALLELSEAELTNIGVRSRSYALRWHSPELIAQTFAHEYLSKY